MSQNFECLWAQVINRDYHLSIKTCPVRCIFHCYDAHLMLLEAATLTRCYSYSFYRSSNYLKFPNLSGSLLAELSRLSQASAANLSSQTAKGQSANKRCSADHTQKTCLLSNPKDHMDNQNSFNCEELSVHIFAQKHIFV